MTLPYHVRRNDHDGNGSAYNYTFGFKILDDDDIEVIVYSEDDDEETTLTKTTHYTVNGVGDRNGGSIDLVRTVAFAWIDANGYLEDGYHITIRGKRTYYQGTRVRDDNTLNLSAIEEALDDLAIQTQQLREELARAVKLRKTSTETDIEIRGTLSDSENELMKVSSDGEALEPSGLTATQLATYASNAAASANAAATSESNAASSASNASTSATAAAASASSASASAAAAAASAATVGTPIQEVLAGTYNGGTGNTTFTMSQTPGSVQTVKAFLGTGRVRQALNVDFTVSGATITFAGQDVSAEALLVDYSY